MSSERPAIVFEGVHKRFGPRQVLGGVDLAIAQGEIFAIIGPSGTGKSVTLKLASGQLFPTSGTVRLLGEDLAGLSYRALARLRRRVGYLFQSGALLGWKTLAENVALPLMFRGVPRREREEAARKMLCRVGLPHRLDHFPRQMSGGQQQRVGIARAFIARPDVVFADEPTGNLDSKTTVEIMEMICAFSRKYHQTIILVTHDPEMAAYADRIVRLIDGEIVSDEARRS